LPRALALKTDRDSRIAQSSDHFRTSLHGGALHVMHDGSQTTEFLAAARSTWPTVDETRKRRTMTCRKPRSGFVYDKDSPMLAGKIGCHRASGLQIRREDGAHKTSPSTIRNGYRVTHVVIRHQGTDWTECLDAVHSCRTIRAATQQ
jgi:hypothetical protein